MDNNTGYIITSENAMLISYVSGLNLKTIEANKGWVACFNENWMPFWRLMPKNVAEQEKNFRLIFSKVDTPVLRSIEEIAAERNEVTRKYADKMHILNDEYDAIMEALSRKKQGL